MPPAKSNTKSLKKASDQLRHNPLGGSLEIKNRNSTQNLMEEDDLLNSKLTKSIMKQAKEQRYDEEEEDDALLHYSGKDDEEDEDDAQQAIEENFVYIDEDGKVFDGELEEDEEKIVGKFLSAGLSETRTLADIILEKLREKEEENVHEDAEESISQPVIPHKVNEVYTSVGTMLQHYKSGKLPKALKMLPHLKNWEHILWLTRPDLWSPCSTFAVTRIFASNLNVKMAQRFFNLVLLEKCREDIRNNNKLNYHLYLALKKALFKPAAFYKGVLLPLAQSGTCTLREAIIFSSVVAKVSIPGIHSAAALLRLTEMPFSGSTSVFIKVLLAKKYALPRRVIDALVEHFTSFIDESRDLPVVWHQSLLTFVQRYKMELNDIEVSQIMELIRRKTHTEISNEVRRELVHRNR